MNYLFHPTGNASFTTTNETPQALVQYAVPGSKVKTITGKFGVALIQEVDMGAYYWQYLIIDINESVSFREAFDVPVIMGVIVLEGNFEYRSAQDFEFQLISNQISIAGIPVYHNILHFEQGNRYVYLRIAYPKDYILYTLSFFPAFNLFAKNLERFKQPQMIDRPMYADAKLLDLVHQLSHSFFSVSVQALHVSILKEIWTAILKQLSSGHSHKNNFSLGYIERIHEAKEFIDVNLPSHFSIGHIARKVAINEQKLKYGFKRIYGMGLYEYMRMQVLAIAKIQLEETDKPIKEIAYDGGYRSQGNFTTAFKKRYGMSPNAWRLKQVNLGK